MFPICFPVTIPYPAGTGRSGYDFMAVHMFTTGMNGNRPGDTETPEITKTGEGIRFTLYSLSPVTISWKEAAAGSREEEVYQCKYCGDIKYRLEIPNSAYAKFNRDAVTAIDRAAAEAAVKITTNLWVSFRKEVIEILKERPDVTLTIDYLYQGIPYTVTIPAGADLEALEESEGYYGFRYLDQVFGGKRIN